MTLSYTNRFHLAIPDFLSEPWHAEFAQAMQSIDDALYGAIITAGSELWANDTAYEIGDIVVDPDTGGLYSASVSHTSNAAGVFADDIANWTSFALTIATQLEAEEGTNNTAYMTPLRVAQAIDVQSPTPGVATQEQAEVGTNNTEMMTPLRTVNQIDARLATQLQAEAGADEEALMTPLRTAQFLDAAGLVGGTQIGFHVHKNAVDQTGIASSVATKVTFSTEFYDLGSYFDTANSRWTPPSGLVHISGAVMCTGVLANQGLRLFVYKNGVAFRDGLNVTAITTDGVQLSIDDSASGTDYYELFVTLVSGGTGTVVGTVTETYFLGHFLGETGTVTLGHEEIGFRATKSANQTGIASGVATKLTFTTETYDQGGFYDAANSRWTPSTGLVHLDGGMYLTGVTASGVAAIYIYKNGAAVKSSFTISPTTEAGVEVSVDDVASGTDYYELYVVLTSGATGTAVNATHTYFSGHRVGGPQGETGDTGPSGPTGTVTGAFGPPQGRLTLTTLTPVMTSTVSAAATIYYTPYVGDQVPIYDGVDWSMMSIGIQLSITTADATQSPAAIGVSKCNDWFVWNDTGTLKLSHGPDWTSNTARGTGAGTTELTRLRGIYVNAFDITNGPDANLGTYVGTTRSNASSTLDWIFGALAVGGTAGFFGLWNCYNRVHVASMTRDSIDAHTPGGSVWVAAFGSNNNRCTVMRGLDEDAVLAQFSAFIYAVTSGAHSAVGVGLDSLTAYSGITGVTFGGFTASSTAIYNGVPGLGVHYLQALTYGSGSLYYGDAGLSALWQGGLSVSFTA